jgi:hypothetical protein
MEKNIKDYLHLYFKCWGLVSNSKSDEYEDGKWVLSCGVHEAAMLGLLMFTPILRPLSDMTEEEENMYYSFYHNPFSKNVRQSILMDSQAIHYLLSKYFDLFGLIEAGLAIDATKQNTNL